MEAYFLLEVILPSYSVTHRLNLATVINLGPADEAPWLSIDP